MIQWGGRGATRRKKSGICNSDREDYMDIDQFHELMDEISAGIPEEILRDLNGGIVLLPEAKLHRDDLAGNLYTLGEYRVQIPGMGRYVAIFYGSFIKVHGLHPNRRKLREELRKTLLHELRHHLESLAGVRDLEVFDDEQIAKYKEQHKKTSSSDT